jgi:hypothetical protein
VQICKYREDIWLGIQYTVERKKPTNCEQRNLPSLLFVTPFNRYDVTKYSYGVLGKARTLLAELKRISERSTRFSRKILFLQGRAIQLAF